MAVTANQKIVAQDPEGLLQLTVTAGVTIYEGTLVYIVAATGLATDVIAAGANHFAGIAKGKALAGEVVEVYTRGTFKIPSTAAAAALVGDKAYGIDNFSCDATATSQTLLGRFTELVETSVSMMVELDFGVA